MQYSTLLLLMLVFSCSLTAADARFTLTLTPDKCALSAEVPSCQTLVDIAIRADYSGTLCVIAQAQRLCAWHQPEQITRLRLALHSAETVPIELWDEQQVVQRTEFQVYRFVEKKRPRRGYLWNSL